ncbi:hypothetical protein MKW98_024374 [Papaver atlanticum]|uniref:Uncharacterized protein n=1 Tax=Papaver atlanticum TaxID=357466 RepID=A0AAD4SYF9_9MAGN|nr:hypothetical protein MKW98_024374 [Papaver atlanticum]
MEKPTKASYKKADIARPQSLPLRLLGDKTHYDIPNITIASSQFAYTLNFKPRTETQFPYRLMAQNPSFRPGQGQPISENHTLSLLCGLHKTLYSQLQHHFQVEISQYNVKDYGVKGDGYRNDIQLFLHNLLLGDDCVSIISNSSRVRIMDISCKAGHGISIGSLGKYISCYQVHDVLVEGAFLRKGGLSLSRLQEVQLLSGNSMFYQLVQALKCGVCFQVA